MHAGSKPTSCPRCGEPLDQSAVEQVALRACKGCGGHLVPHRSLHELLHRLALSLAAKVDVNRPQPALPDPSGALRCPDCGRHMEHYGYMGERTIMIDRCEACAHLWLDARELVAMALELARTDLRKEEVEVAAKEYRKSYLDPAEAERAIAQAETMVDRLFRTPGGAWGPSRIDPVMRDALLGPLP